MKNPIATEGRLICEMIEQESKTKSGILLAKPANVDTGMGKVLSVGCKKYHANQDFNVGQIVYWQMGLGQEIDVEGKKCIILNQDQILAVESDN